MKPGDRVLRRSDGYHVGQVLAVGDYRATVEWPGGATSECHVSLLRVVPPRAETQPPVSIAAVVATEAVEARMEHIVYEVTEVIATLVRTVCMGERDLYRDLLERVAQRLGDV